MPRPSVSVITVALNSSATIGDTVESVASQDDGTLQYILIDGVSSDDTVKIVERYRSTFGSRLTILSERDNGIYEALNKGIGLASGDIIAILHSDDRWLPGTVSAVRKAFEDHTAEIVFGDVVIVDSAGSTTFRASLRGLKHRMTLAHPACFVRRSTYHKYGFFRTEFKIAADYEFLLRCHRNKVRFLRIDSLLAVFSAGGASGNSFAVLKELFVIHSGLIGTTHAIRCFTRRFASLYFFLFRRRIALIVLGRKRVDRIRRSLRY